MHLPENTTCKNCKYLLLKQAKPRELSYAFCTAMPDSDETQFKGLGKMMLDEVSILPIEKIRYEKEWCPLYPKPKTNWDDVYTAYRKRKAEKEEQERVAKAIVSPTVGTRRMMWKNVTPHVTWGTFKPNELYCIPACPPVIKTRKLVKVISCSGNELRVRVIDPYNENVFKYATFKSTDVEARCIVKVRKLT